MRTLDDRDSFSCPLTMAKDRFDALFNYFKTGEWTGNEVAVVRHDGLVDGNQPIDGVVHRSKIMNSEENEQPSEIQIKGHQLNNSL